MKRLKKKMRPQTRERGFTTVELLTVFAIVAIMVSLAVFSFHEMAARSRLKAAARDIVSNMQLTRINALKSSSAWAVQFDTNSTTYRILSDKGADGTWNTSDDTVFRTVDFSAYPGISYGSTGNPPERPGATASPADAVSFGGVSENNRVNFNPDGTSISGTVYIKNKDGDTFAVGSLSTTGRIKTWHYHGGVWE
ncbi:MAG: GspH/FimT family pseudopilin [Thermodesulfobacteriota bacterium]|nr:GspH/FimT family pseudopilin [Thermodesulfobacteriota bacterium]